MRSDSLKRRIRKSLGKKSAKAEVPSEEESQEEVEYAEAIPAARCHNIELDWNGKRYRFQMNINDHPMLGGEVLLGNVYDIDPDNDEWVEVPGRVLESARNDNELMGRLHRDIDAMESDLDSSDVCREESELYSKTTEKVTDDE